MKSENVAILILFVLVIVLVYKVYFRGRKHGLFSSKKGTEIHMSFDKLVHGNSNKVYQPATLTELKNIFIDNPGQTVRVTGDNYTFNDISFSDEILIRTSKLSKILGIDPDTKEVTVEAGCKIRDICVFLAEQNLALETVPQNIDQTIASVCSIAGHSSNVDTGTMSDQIVDLVVVLGNGNIRRVEFDDPEFPAYATGLGCLGAIYSITVKCVDNYNIETVIENSDWSKVKTKLNTWTKEYPSVTVHINLKDGSTKTVLERKVSTDVPNSKPYYLSGVKNNINYTRSEVAVNRQFVTPAVDHTLQLCKNAIANEGMLTITFTGADYNSWLSPASGKQCAWLEVSYLNPEQNTSEILKQFQDFEDLLIYKWKGRPNWTTTKFMSKYKTKLVYGLSLDYFNRVRESFDPNDVFLNDFTTRALL